MKTVIEMAREAGFEARRGWWVRDQVPEDIFAASVNITTKIEAFAALVRADEREACMNALNALPYQRSTKYDCMDAIRARGETKCKS